MDGKVDEARFEWPHLIVRSARDPIDREPFQINSRPLHHVWLLVDGAPTILKRTLGQQRWSADKMSPGDVNICSAGEPDFEFGWKSESGARAPEFAQVFLDRAVVDRVADEHGHRPVVVPPRIGVRDPLLTELVIALCRCVRSPEQADAMFVDAAAELLAVHLLRGNSDVSLGPKGRDRALPHATVMRVQRYIDGGLAQPLRAVDLAAVAGLSVHHFSRAFRLATGETPHGFTLRLRIERAERLLRESDVGLADVASATGFSSQSHFTTQYRRIRGITPGVFKRRQSRSKR